jgi:hypothetical protein
VLDPPKGEGKDVVLVRDVLLDIQRGGVSLAMCNLCGETHNMMSD